MATTRSPPMAPTSGRFPASARPNTFPAVNTSCSRRDVGARPVPCAAHSTRSGSCVRTSPMHARSTAAAWTSRTGRRASHWWTTGCRRPALPRHDGKPRLASSSRGGQSRMYYVARGSIPRQRHTQHRAADGSLYAEDLFGVEGFTGRSSLLYHLTPPTRTHRIEAGPRIELEPSDDGLHRHRLTKTGAVERKGDIVSGRIPLYFNHDVVFGIVRPAA